MVTAIFTIMATIIVLDRLKAYLHKHNLRKYKYIYK